jgi:DUF2938 family protein
MTVTLWRSVILGIISTASMDLLSVAAIRLRLMAPLSPNLVGRWFASVARAQPFHADIARASPVGYELAIAVPVHYTIGVVLSALYVWGMSQLGWSPRNPALALAYGICTSLLPWLIMFPAMGYGIFGSHGPAETRLFLSSLMSHAFFGLGIWVGVRIVSGV